MEEFIESLASLDPVWIYAAVAAIAYIENIFPPFPSDVIVVFAGSLVGVGSMDFTTALLLATTASTLGFVTMYKVGDWFGDHILEAGKIRFIPKESVQKVERWFQKYGYFVIVANRFLAGTRAVVSFFAGMSEMSLLLSVVLSFLSALIWNFILLTTGRAVGENWREIGSYLETYSAIVTSLIVLVAVFFLVRFFLKRSSNKTDEPPTNA
jgi:membrane protein DedA with SNARE-associated domain